MQLFLYLLVLGCSYSAVGANQDLDAYASNLNKTTPKRLNLQEERTAAIRSKIAQIWGALQEAKKEYDQKGQAVPANLTKVLKEVQTHWRRTQSRITTALQWKKAEDFLKECQQGKYGYIPV